MPFITYTALRSLKTGHTASVAYTINFDAQALNKSHKTIKTRTQSLGGNTETIRVRRDTFWNIKTDLLAESELDDWREFLASTDAGETFTFDAYGTAASPDDPISVEREDEDDAEERVGETMYYTVSFKVRAL